MIKHKPIKDVIDNLLDMYNDYHALYNMFGDDYYLLNIDIILIRLKELTIEG